MPAPRFWKTATLHVDPPCPLRAINGGYCPWRCGELTAWLEVILPADAPAPARLTSRLGFPTSEWRRRHAAPPSRPTPSETLVEFVVGVSDLRPQFSSTTSGSLEGHAASQSAAAGEQARPPTCLLHLCLGGGLPPCGVPPRPTRQGCATPGLPALFRCLAGTLIAARASNSPSRCAGRWCDV